MRRKMRLSGGCARSAIRPGALPLGLYPLSAAPLRSCSRALDAIATAVELVTPASVPENFAADRHGSPAQEQCEGAQLETRDLPLELW